ncbi:hypothetical protein JG688_00010894 [Phytophthora aleatoria]|uniref:Uncharacterized protein n=1 Tax=Phytophthora aleatoria TaxID=2496075 RepID=A0A8J5MEX8_9STRA|nr:hypothetical protein JG688_00010894 [Phytophthora aleatoria]
MKMVPGSPRTQIGQTTFRTVSQFRTSWCSCLVVQFTGDPPSKRRSRCQALLPNSSRPKSDYNRWSGSSSWSRIF